MDIDAVIAEAAQPDATKTADTVIAETPEPESEQPAEVTPAEPEAPWPKKAENALAKAKGKEAKLKFQLEQERAARVALEQRLNANPKPAETKPSGEPKEADYQHYHEYMRAVQKYDLQQELAGRDTKQQETQQSQQLQAWENQRLDVIDKQAEEFTKQFPEIETIFEENLDTIKEYPTYIKHLFLEADNAPLALYNLAKEGKLEALGTMSLAKAAIEIGRAQTQAISKLATKAPAPLSPAKGTGSGGKTLADMSPKEILAAARRG